MRRSTLLVLLMLVALLMMPPGARAATQVFMWPSRFSFGTPSGTFGWNATNFGARFGPGFGPVEFGTMLYYGPISNMSFAGSTLSGYSGQLVGGETGLRFGLGVGPVGMGAFAGYGGFVFNARGPAASDAVLLSSLGFRLGVDARMTVAPGVSLRGSWTALSGLNNTADISLSSPAVVAQSTGTGSGSEYTLGVTFAPLPLVSAFAEYRSGTFLTNWSGGTRTSSSYSGYFLGVQFRF